MGNDIEAYCFGKGSALADGHDITNVTFKGRGAMDRDVTVTFFVTSVLGDVVEVITTDDNGAFHLAGDHKTFKDTSSNGHVSGKGAFFIHVVTFDGGLWCFKSKTNGSVVAWGTSLHQDFLATKEDAILLLEALLILYGK